MFGSARLGPIRQPFASLSQYSGHKTTKRGAVEPGHPHQHHVPSSTVLFFLVSSKLNATINKHWKGWTFHQRIPSVFVLTRSPFLRSVYPCFFFLSFFTQSLTVGTVQYRVSQKNVFIETVGRE